MVTSKAMKPVVRAFESADLPAAARLHARLYRHEGHDDVDWYFSLWRWLEAHPLGGDICRWVLSDGDQMVGFLAVVPQFYRIGGERVVAHTPTDYMVEPHHGFHAISLMREFFRSCPNCVSCDWLPTTIGVIKWLGAEEAGEFQHFVKVLDFSLFSRAIPGPLRWLLNRGLEVVDKALMGAPGPFKVEVLEGFDERFDRLFEKVAAAIPCLPEKDAAFLRWRYGPGSPHAEKFIIAVQGEEGLLGYAVLRITWTGRDGYVMDLTVLPGRHDVARELLRYAVGHFRRAGAQVIRYRYMESPSSPRAADVKRLGFFLRKWRHRLLVRFQDPGLQKVARQANHWAYNAGDGEMSFWVR